MDDIRIYIVYNWFIYLTIFIIGLLYLYRNKQLDNKNISSILFVLIVCYALFYNSNFDYYRLKYAFYYKESSNVRLEPIYNEIAKVCFNSYDIFRILIWGTALSFFCKAVKELKLNTTTALVLVGVLYIKTFSYARVSLAVCCLILCYTLFLNFRNKPRKILALLLFVLSICLHKTMIFLWFIMFVAYFIKPKKSNVIKAIAAFPVIAICSNALIRTFISLVHYISAESNEYATSVMTGENAKDFSFYYIMTLMTIAIPFFISLFKVIEDKASEHSIRKIAMSTFFIIYVSFVFLTIDFGNVNLLCKRFLNLSIPFALITITYAYAKYANCRRITNCCVLVQGIMLLYYAIHIYNTIDIRDDVIF